MLKTHRIIPLVFILFLFGLTLIPAPIVIAQQADDVVVECRPVTTDHKDKRTRGVPAAADHKDRRTRGVPAAAENGMERTETANDHEDADGVYQTTI